MRILVDDQRFDSDPEGIGYARAINAHLPPTVRVLAVQVGGGCSCCSLWVLTPSSWPLPADAFPVGLFVI